MIGVGVDEGSSEFLCGVASLHHETHSQSVSRGLRGMIKFGGNHKGLAVSRYS